MYKRRGVRRFQLGRWLALFALSLRLVAPLLAALPPPADAAELVRLFGPHALCLSQETGEPRPGPADRPSSDGIDHQFGTCCFWHCNPGLGAPPPMAVAPVAFASSGATFPPAISVVSPFRRSGTASARAPPREA